MSHTNSPVGKSAVPSDGENGDGAPPPRPEIRDPDLDFVESRSLLSPKWAAIQADLAEQTEGERPEGENGRRGEGENGGGAPPPQSTVMIEPDALVEMLSTAGVYECWRVAKLLEQQDQLLRERLLDEAVANDATKEDYDRIYQIIDEIDRHPPRWKRLTRLSDVLDPRQRAANIGVLLKLVERLARYELANFHRLLCVPRAAVGLPVQTRTTRLTCLGLRLRTASCRARNPLPRGRGPTRTK